MTADISTLPVAFVPNETEVGPRAWSVYQRIGFRIAFVYFFCFLFLFGNGTLFELIPVVGGQVSSWLSWPLNQVAEWLGVHLFHLTGTAAHWHRTGSGDTALNWILSGLFVALALVGGLLWTALAEVRSQRRLEYTTLYGWLRFLLRLTCAMFMLEYGFAKVYPLQMIPVSIAVLNEPVGNISPMTMLWSMLGMNTAYQMICGAAEVLGGLLLLYRPTALLGALFSAFVMSNVLLYNMFFDVPVKLFAAGLLLAEIFLILPDADALLSFFWRHRPAVPAGVWFPPVRRRRWRITTRVFEWIVAVAAVLSPAIFIGIAWHQTQIARHTSSPLLGAWHLDATHPASGALITGDGAPGTDLYLDAVNRGFARSTDGELWRTGMHIDAKAHTITIFPYGGAPGNYSWQMPDNNHLVLTSVPPKAGKGKQPDKKFVPATMTFTRTPLPKHYPLLERGFHLVNEWGYER